ncbi:hypothetical protein BLA29_013640, partial [Euroglyphus maynei]
AASSIADAASVASSVLSKKSQTTKSSTKSSLTAAETAVKIAENKVAETKAKVTVPTRDVIDKLVPAKHLDDDDYDSDSSRTCSADETKECEEELRRLESLGMNGINDIKNSKTREEFEASEALISLAASWFEQTTGDDFSQHQQSK